MDINFDKIREKVIALACDLEDMMDEVEEISYDMENQFNHLPDTIKELDGGRFEQVKCHYIYAVEALLDAKWHLNRAID